MSLSNVRPNSYSKTLQASKGSHNSAEVLSISAYTLLGNSSVATGLEAIRAGVEMDWIATMTSRSLSGAKVKVRLFALYIDVS